MKTKQNKNRIEEKYLTDKVTFKVIPLKLFYYQTFFETWHNEHVFMI